MDNINREQVLTPLTVISVNMPKGEPVPATPDQWSGLIHLAEYGSMYTGYMWDQQTTTLENWELIRLFPDCL